MERLNLEQLIIDVNKQGYEIVSHQDLKKLKTRDKVIVPVLVKYLKNVNFINEKEFFVRCLGVKGFNDATKFLIDEFSASDNRAYKWAIGNSLSIILDKRYENDYIDIIKNKQHGTARQMVVVTLGKVRSEKAISYLIDLLSDEEVCGHVIIALGYYKDHKIIQNIKPFLDHKEKWIRKEAEKAMKKLQKHM
ncbi:MAG: HEAT repeat domain-containing protein [Halanaerobiales bacterium]|nr:HEAT repeat domain-containing protein [Halanaerobiales bacterium]